MTDLSCCQRNGPVSHTIRIGYTAIAVFLMTFLARRGMEEFRGLVFKDPRCGFNPASVHLTPSPNWAGQCLEARLQKETQYLRGCPVLHPEFCKRLRAAVARVPWVRSVQDVSLHRDGGFQVRVKYRRPVARLCGTDQFVDIDGVDRNPHDNLMDIGWDELGP